MVYPRIFLGPFFHFLGIVFILALCSCKETPEPQSEPLPQLPHIQEPDLSISSIKILQAELVNTRLRVQIRIDNPNPFPVTLSSFVYELYGEGRFWADGKEKNVYTVPAGGYAEKELFLVMNFIDMRRDILDKVIAMDRVKYRFKGTVEISAVDLPFITKNFNLEGESEVTQ
jgi:LEA14-like dessication related protein